MSYTPNVKKIWLSVLNKYLIEHMLTKPLLFYEKIHINMTKVLFISNKGIFYFIHLIIS